MPNESTTLMSPPLVSAVNTEASIENSQAPEQDYARAWEEVIDHTLIEWGRGDCDIWDDEGFQRPSIATLQLAIKVASSFRDNSIPPPDFVVTDPNGGIVFEFRLNEIKRQVHIWDDQTFECRSFEGDRLVDRQVIS